MKLHYRIGWLLMRWIARVLWGYRIEGSESIPASGPVIIASNHISFWDPILVGLGCPREVHFMAKEELFRNRFLGWLIRAYNAFPVRRGILDRQGLRSASDLLRKGNVLLLFPEGTRSKTGEPREARPGVGFLACTAGATVVPACIEGSNRLARHFVTRAPVRLSFAEAIDPGEGGSREDYQRLADGIMSDITRLRHGGRTG